MLCRFSARHSNQTSRCMKPVTQLCNSLYEGKHPIHNWNCNIYQSQTLSQIRTTGLMQLGKHIFLLHTHCEEAEHLLLWLSDASWRRLRERSLGALTFWVERCVRLDIAAGKKRSPARRRSGWKNSIEIHNGKLGTELNSSVSLRYWMAVSGSIHSSRKHFYRKFRESPSRFECTNGRPTHRHFLYRMMCLVDHVECPTIV